MLRKVLCCVNTLFLLIVSLISVNIIAPLAAMFSASEFSLEMWGNVLRLLPFIWIAVVIFVILTNPVARLLKEKVLAPTDSFNANIIVELPFNVFLMSILMTIVGGWIGAGGISWVPLENFFYNWPRNFAVAFAVEALIAHPVAHFVMHTYHIQIDASKK